jgi:hypothetical protein
MHAAVISSHPKWLSRPLVPYSSGIFAKAGDIVGLEVIGIALVIIVAIAVHWILGAARTR